MSLLRSFALVALAAVPAAGRAEIVVEPEGHTAPVRGMVFTPDGKQLVSVSVDKTVRVWTLADGTSRVIYTPRQPGPRGMHYAVAISPDGQTLAVGGYEVGNAVLMLSLKDGAVLKTLNGHSGVADALAFSHDGRWLASAGEDKTVRVWRMAEGSGTEHLVLTGHTSRVKALAFSPHSQWLASGDDAGDVRLWHVEKSGKAFDLAHAEFNLMGQRPAEVLAKSPELAVIVAIRSDFNLMRRLRAELAGSLFLPALPDGGGIGLPLTAFTPSYWKKHAAEIDTFAWVPGSNRLYSHSLDGKSAFWNGELWGPTFWGGSVVGYSSDGRYVLVARSDGTLSYTDLTTKKTVETLPERSVLEFTNARVSRDGRLFASPDPNSRNAILVREIGSGKVRHKLGATRYPQPPVGWVKGGRAIAFYAEVGGGADCAQRAFRLTDFAFEKDIKIETWQPPDPPGEEVGWRNEKDREKNPQPKKDALVITAGPDRYTLPLPEEGHTAVRMLPGGKVVLGTNWHLSLFDGASGSELKQFDVPQNGITDSGLALAPSRRYLLAQGHQHVIHLLSLQSTSPVLSFFFAGDDWAAWTPDGIFDASPGGKKLLRWQSPPGQGSTGQAWELTDEAHGGRQRPEDIRFLARLVTGPAVTGDDVARAVRDDLQSAAPEDRPFRRYFSLAHLYAVAPEEHPNDVLGKFRDYRHGLSFTVNSLSWRPKVVAPTGVDGLGTVFRIDLRDYGWDADYWARIAAEYPYAILPATDIAREAARLAGTDLPCVRADWFVAAAFEPTLYHALLGLPQTAQELERRLGVDVAANIAAGRVLRAGFRTSRVSRSNRLVERHATDYGAYWKSYDFAGEIGPRNLFAFPLGPGDGRATFTPDGQEIVFNLPNGLQAYLLADRTGRRLKDDVAPLAIVSDNERQFHPAVVNAVSCVLCHDSGMNTSKWSKKDQVRQHAEQNRSAFGDADRRAVFATYPPDEVLRPILAADARRFQRAATEAGEPLFATSYGTGPYGVSSLISRYESTVDDVQAPAELGMSRDEFRAKLAASRPDIRRLVGTLLQDGGQVKRPVFDLAFPVLVRAFRLGEYRAPRPFAPPPPAARASGTPPPADPAGVAEHLGRGKDLFAKGDLDRAAIEFTEALRCQPDSAAARRERGWTYLTRGEPDRAIPDLDKALAADPNDIESLSLRARAHFALTNFAGAAADAKAVLRQTPDDAATLILSGRARQCLGDRDGARADLEAAARSEPASAAAHARLGLVHLDAGDSASAHRCFETALGLAPDDAAGHIARIEARLARQEYGVAVDDCKSALAVADDVAPVAERPAFRAAVLFLQADAESRLGRATDAAKALAAAAQASPFAHAEFYRTQAALLARARDDRRAADAYTTLLGLRPGDAGALVARSEVLGRLDESEAALRDCEAALRLRPGWRAAFCRQAAVRAAKADYAAAADALTEALRAAPRDAELYKLRGGHYARAGVSWLAQADWDRAVRLAGPDPTGRWVRAWIANERCDYAAAVAACREAVPATASTHCEWAYGLWKLGQTKEAGHHFRQARELAFDDVNVLSEEATYFHNVKADDRARANRQAIARLNPLNADNLTELAEITEDADAAVALWERAIRLRPGHGEFRHKLALLHYNRGHYAVAVRGFTAALDAEPDAPPEDRVATLLMRARARKGQGPPDIDGAFRDIDEAVRLAPADAKLFRLRAELHRGAERPDAAVEDECHAAAFEELAKEADAPPARGRPAAADLADAKYADAGVAALVDEDRAALAPADRPFARYLSLAHLYRASLENGADPARAAADLDSFRKGLVAALRLAAANPTAHRPQPLDAARVVYRIDLRDYGMTPETWVNLAGPAGPPALPVEEFVVRLTPRAPAGAAFAPDVPNAVRAVCRHVQATRR